MGAIFNGTGSTALNISDCQFGVVYWDGNSYMQRSSTHFAVQYDPGTNILSGTSSEKANNRSKSWYAYIAPISYF